MQYAEDKARLCL